MGEFANPQSSGTEVAAIFQSSQQVVEDRLKAAIDYADGTMNTAEAFLDSLQSAAGSFGFSITRLNSLAISPISYNFNPGDLPEAPDTGLIIPPVPTATVDDDLLTPLKSKILAKIAAGGTGLDPAVEADIFNCEYERGLLALQESNERIADDWAKRGLPLPDGVLVQALTNAEIDFRNKRLDTSRDIAVKQAELAWQQTQEIIRQATGLHLSINQTLVARFQAHLEGFKTNLSALIERVKISLQAYQTQVEGYKAKAEAQAAIANVDVRAQEASINVAVQQAQLFLKQAEINIQSFAESAKLRVAAAEGGARVAAQITAGVFSGISVQAHLGAQGSAGKTYSGQEQLSESHQYTEK